VSKIVIFSGTTEGRRLSEKLSDAGIAHDVCVATDYGADVMRQGENVTVHVGRMDADRMYEFLTDREFAQGDCVIDATHPYAVEVTENIKAAAGRTKAEYIRVIRGSEDLSGEGIISHEDIASVATDLEHTEGNILLTTGSKELHAYHANSSRGLFERTYVRVLPTRDSLDICLAEGIDPKRIVAAVGPFSKEMNIAVIRQYDIRHLVTKESGHEGGYDEKIKAASETGITCHVISRPVTEEGLSVEEAFRHITGREASESRQQDGRSERPDRDAERAGDSHEQSNGRCRMVLAGYGPGSDSSVTFEVRQAIEEADAVFGAGRLISGLNALKKYEMYLAKDIIPVLEKDKDIRNAVILFTGDSGFYSGAAKMLTELRAWDKDADISVMPGISSVSVLAARLGVSYNDTELCSIHGRKDTKTLNILTDRIMHSVHTFVLVSGDEDIRDIGAELVKRGIECDIDVGIDLTYPDERILTVRPGEAADFKSEGIMAAHIFNGNAKRRRAMNVLRDDAFIRDKVPMTKENVRHLSLIELDIRQGDVVWDIGGGTGSISVEAGGLDPTVNIYVFEKKKDACDLIRINAAKHGADNVTLIEGEVPGSLEGIEDPDRVFIGGSGGRLREIVDAIRVRKRGIRYVINAITEKTMDETMRIIDEYGAVDVRIMQIAVSTMDVTADPHELKANNPVMIYSFVL